MHHKFLSMVPKTEFGKWLHSMMVRQEMDCDDLAKKLHVTRQTVAFHVSGHHLPNYPFVVAYCRVFGCDPDVIWLLVA